MYTKQQLTSMTEAKLAELATDMGLELNTAEMPKKTVVAEILKAQEEDALSASPEPQIEDEAEDEVEDDEEEEEEEEAPKPKAAKAKKPEQARKYKIIIHNQDGVNNTPFVKVGVNGKIYTIPREKEVVIPYDVKHVLDSATETHYETEVSGRDKRSVERQVRRFPMSVLEVL